MYFDTLMYNGKIHTFENPYEIFRSMLIKDGKIVKLYKENYVEEDIDLKNDVGNMVDLEDQIIIPAFICKEVYILPLLLYKYNKYLRFNTLGEAEVYFDNLDKEKKELILEDGLNYLEKTCLSTIFLRGDSYAESINNRVNEFFKKNININFIMEDTKKRTINNDELISSMEDFKGLNPLSSVKEAIKKDMYPYLAMKKELYVEAREANHLEDMGLLKENYYANFMILNNDIFTVEKKDIDELKIEKVYAFGREVQRINQIDKVELIKNFILKKEA